MIHSDLEYDELRAQVQAWRQSVRANREALFRTLSAQGIDPQAVLEDLMRAPESVRQKAEALLRTKLASTEWGAAILNASSLEQEDIPDDRLPDKPFSPPVTEFSTRLIGSRLGSRI